MHGLLYKALWLIHAAMLGTLILTVVMIVGGLILALVALPFLR